MIIRAAMQDSSRRNWQSFAGFLADVEGNVHLNKQPPVNGSYTGINASGLLQFINLPGQENNRTRFFFNKAEPLTVKLSVEVNSKTITQKEIVIHFMREGTTIKDISEDGLVARLYLPAGSNQVPGIVILGGSEGGISGDDIAAVLSSNGYAAMTVAYFGAPGLPQSLEEIPLEYFKKAIDKLLNEQCVRKKGIVFLRTSKGAEAALLSATIYKEVIGVVGYVPGNVVWSCICNSPGKSSWLYKGNAVPFIPQDTDPTYKPTQGFPINPSVNYLYRYSKNAATTATATIAVEKINGPVMLISGVEDELWPSDMMAREIMKRLKISKHPHKSMHLSYANAGHLIGKLNLPSGSTLHANGRLNSGGTPAGNAAAQKDSWPRVLKFIESIFIK